MDRLFLNAVDTMDSHRCLTGGKAYNLARLSRQGLPVPEWFALSKAALELFIRHNDLSSLVAVPEASAAFEEKVLTAFLGGCIPDALVAQLRATLQASGLNQKLLAVRSSGLDEDGAQHSFAGQFSSFLFRQGEKAVCDAIVRCWASGYSQRVIAYRRKAGINGTIFGMGVVIQEMVDGECAGVLFSRHPIKVLNRDLILISSVYGAGEGLVSGLLTADTYELSRAHGTIAREIGEKSDMLVRDPNGGLMNISVPIVQQKQSSLTDEQVRELGRLANEIEESNSAPQDIEWVISGGKIHLVQTRPITTLPAAACYDEKINGSRPILWDNSNIVESYSDVTSPLTFSFASRAYNQVYIQFYAIMGVSDDVITQSTSAFRNLLGLVRGRIYYNLMHWYELVLNLPGTSSNKSFMETMMGVKQSLPTELVTMFDRLRKPPQYGIVATSNIFIKTIWRFIRIDSIIRDFYLHFNKIYDDARSRDLRDMGLPELVSYYHFLEENFLKRWHAPIINDYLCMIFFGLLKKLTVQWIGSDEMHSLQNDLLCGEGGLESTKPTKYLMGMAQTIADGDTNFRAFFTESSPTEVILALRGKYKATAIAQSFEEFLDKYGFRCINELKLEEPDLHDDPSFVVYAILGFLRTSSYRIEDLERREQEIRLAAEKTVRSKISGYKLLVYNMILKQARRAVKNRENLRFARTKTFGIARHLFRAIGGALKSCEIINEESDIFYLTIDEIIGYVEGRVVHNNLKELIALRRKEYDEYRNSPPPPERFLTHGAVGVSNGFPALLMEADLLRSSDELFAADADTLRGTPCSPGVVEGEVMVARSLADAMGLDGHILVTARTDPGWVPLFPSCSGLLIERGSQLSHSAVVARELGLPTIVGIRGGLMQRLKSGDRVRMDASKGEVTILSNNSLEN